jgi:hypothetical protein
MIIMIMMMIDDEKTENVVGFVGWKIKPRMAKLGQPKTFFSSELSNLYMSLNHFDVVKPFRCCYSITS